MRTADVELDRFDRHTGQIAVNGARFRLLTDTHGPVHLVEVDGVTHRISRDEGGVLRSPCRRWWSPRRFRSARRSRPAHRCWCWRR
ncbi:hypothetical protein V2I01_34260 [Micromonospora sp. BRA006-A]|nr:hypothetical protein [Micromonospora sp. BRA006-A]